jgi:hypothetical protein
MTDSLSTEGSFIDAGRVDPVGSLTLSDLAPLRHPRVIARLSALGLLLPVDDDRTLSLSNVSRIRLLPPTRPPACR